jgi:hypothetical protein
MTVHTAAEAPSRPGVAASVVDATKVYGTGATEVVQLYAADTATGVTLPMQQLVGFARVDLEPGASRTVTFAVPMSLLAYTGLSGDLVMEPGPVELSAGSSSDDIRSSATVTVTGQTRTIDGELLAAPRHTQAEMGTAGMWIGGEAASWFWDARECAPGPQGRPNRPPSTISPGVGRRRRPIDGR